MDIKLILAKNMRYFRGKCGLSQEMLAAEAGLHRTYIASIENQHRNVSIENVDTIASVLKVKAYELLKENPKVDYE